MIKIYGSTPFRDDHVKPCDLYKHNNYALYGSLAPSLNLRVQCKYEAQMCSFFPVLLQWPMIKLCTMCSRDDLVNLLLCTNILLVHDHCS
jgi:hypothetical protein